MKPSGSPEPCLEDYVTCDVAIVGAGFAGLSGAYHLARSGVSVVVVEANAAEWGASGRNGGFCCLGGGKLSDAAPDRLFGRSGRREWWQTEKAAVALVDRLLSELDLDVDRHSTGETYLAHRRGEARVFDKQASAIFENYGVTPDVLTGAQLPSAGMEGPFRGAMTTPVGFALNSRKFIAGLVAAARASGARFSDRSFLAAR